ncbi:unnamed protein product [Plasmodium vivax]|uniref:(malaria parasite P. vivax) hypothetical protein n=1 Tax=Plasmodium vivax TaxID=5855 RepID=A0A8S4H998_PLAVI|nr:unnamed protein product [Plasmodium vivax]
MPEYITDVAKWKNYTFLNEILNVYDEFNKTTEGDNDKKFYIGFCEPVTKDYGDEKDMHKDFCMKLVRNLGYYNLNTKYHNPKSYRCHILYNWIYNKKKNYKYSDDIITKCFADYIHVMSHDPFKHICYYESYNNVYDDPIKITILDIFNDNVKNIIPLLMGKYDTDEFSPQKFVCEFVKIYKYIHNTYCANTDQREGKENITCAKLKALKTTYDNYLLRNAAIKNKIPSLEANDNEYSNKCISQAKGLEAIAFSPGHLVTFSQKRKGSGRYTASSAPSTQDTDEYTGGSMSPTVSTALGTVAGASSLLALLYKFSPGGNWIRSGFRGGRGRISSNVYAEGPSELLFDGMEHNDFNSYSIGYEAI